MVSEGLKSILSAKLEPLSSTKCDIISFLEVYLIQPFYNDLPSWSSWGFSEALNLSYVSGPTTFPVDSNTSPQIRREKLNTF